MGAPLNAAPITGTMCRMNRRATDPRNPVSGPGSENSNIPSLLLPSFFITLQISHRAFSFSGTLRIPKDIVAASKSLVRRPTRFRASPMSRVTISSRFRSLILSLPTEIIFCDGSTPRTWVRDAVAAADASLAALASRIATSAVPVARSNILLVLALLLSFSRVNRSPLEVTALTISTLHAVSMLRARARLIKSYRVAMRSNMLPDPKLAGGGPYVTER